MLRTANILLALSVVTLVAVFAVTMTVQAVPQPPHIVFGAVEVSGLAAGDGVTIEARIGGVDFASGSPTTVGGVYGPDNGVVELGWHGVSLTPMSGVVCRVTWGRPSCLSRRTA